VRVFFLILFPAVIRDDFANSGGLAQCLSHMELLYPYFVSIIVQQDATIYSLFISVNCSTCFGWYLHPSPGAHITVSTVSGIGETVTATYRERSRQVAVTVSPMPGTVDTVI